MVYQSYIYCFHGVYTQTKITGGHHIVQGGANKFQQLQYGGRYIMVYSRYDIHDVTKQYSQGNEPTYINPSNI